jgi:hypothetical protein
MPVHTHDAAAPVYNPWVGFTFGFAAGLATAAWIEPYWGGSFYSSSHWGAYPCCASASIDVYGHWGSGNTGNDRYADSSGNIFQNKGGGWSSAAGNNSWADRESQARRR